MTALALVAFAVFATSMIPSSARADSRPWALGGGVVLTGGFNDQAGGAFVDAVVPWAAVQRPVHRTLWVRSEVAYQRMRGSLRRVDLVPVAAGFRWADVSPGGIGAYIESYWTLFGIRWRGVRDAYEIPRPEFRLTRLVPGLTTGFGLQLQASRSIYMSYGIRIQRSARITEELGSLAQVGFEVGVDWRPPFDR